MQKHSANHLHIKAERSDVLAGAVNNHVRAAGHYVNLGELLYRDLERRAASCCNINDPLCYARAAGRYIQYVIKTTMQERRAAMFNMDATGSSVQMLASFARAGMSIPPIMLAQCLLLV
jgi:hypothetical protein